MTTYSEIIPLANKEFQQFKNVLLKNPSRIRDDFENLTVDINKELSDHGVWLLVPGQFGTLTMSFAVDNVERKMLFRRPGLKKEDAEKLYQLPITAIDEMMINMIETMQLADIQWIPVFTQQALRNK